MRGSDALDFLHRLTTVNVKNMIPGECKPGLFLTPQGKIIAYFHLAYVDRDTFAFIVDDNQKNEWRDSLLKIIDQFTFAEKFILSQEQSFQCVNLLDKNHELDSKFGEKQVLHMQDCYWINLGNHKYGSPLIKVIGSNIPESLKSASSMSTEQMTEQRIKNMYPEIDFEIKLDANPLEIGLVDAIASQKGCYPGQEVIEKIISLGSPAKRLALIESKEPLVCGQILKNDATEQGTITTSSHLYSLALIKKPACQIGHTFNNPNAKVIKITPYEPI